MGTVLKVSLSKQSVDNAIKKIEKYREGLRESNRRFVERLLELGIQAAEDNSKDVSGTFGTHRMGQFVYFSKGLESASASQKGTLVGSGNEVKSGIPGSERTINALMALEFGTAALALEPQTAFGVTGGQGTLSEKGHENDLVWYVYVKDENGKSHKKKLSAIKPTQPMYHASMEMVENIRKAAQECFGTNEVIKC